MENLSETFKKRLEALGLKKQVDAAMICEAFDNAIFEVFGETGANNVKAISFKDGILKVAVSSSSWASEVNLKQLQIKKDEKVRLIFTQS